MPACSTQLSFPSSDQRVRVQIAIPGAKNCIGGAQGSRFFKYPLFSNPSVRHSFACHGNELLTLIRLHGPVQITATTLLPQVLGQKVLAVSHPEPAELRAMIDNGRNVFSKTHEDRGYSMPK